jgi:hypothetical protein
VNTSECVREAEVLDAVLTGGVDDQELHLHVEECETCREVVAVASLLREDRDLARHDVQVPAAGQVWWRAAIRARLDGAHAAARPITWAQGVAAACAAGLAAGGIGIAWPSVESAFGWFGARASSVSPAAIEVADLVSAAVQRSVPFAIAAAACIVLAPLALYLALTDE